MSHGIKTTYEIVGETQVVGNVEATAPKAGFRFGRMFPALAPYRPTDASLQALGDAMVGPPGGADDSTIPAGYTYFGQFIDHDITRDGTAKPLPELGNLEPDTILQLRSPSLDLDSLYGDFGGRSEAFFDPNDPVLFRIGATEPLPGVGEGAADPVTQSLPNDLPRVLFGDDAGRPLIGDDRNDENLVVAQLHLAFLKFHNKAIEAARLTGPATSPTRLFADTRQLVTRHYQWLVLNDFVRRLTDKTVYESVLSVPDLTAISSPIELRPKIFRVTGFETPPMPLEFSVAAYRLGHSMIRNGYSWNRFFPGASLRQLFDFTHTSGALGKSPDGFVALPSNWIADWRRLFDFGEVTGVDAIDRQAVPLNVAKKLDSSIANILGNLPGGGGNLAVRNLQRGSRVGLPCAQDVAACLVTQNAIKESDVLSAAELLSGLPQPAIDTIREHEFDVKTPLWFYVLREAALRGSGDRLGPLGSVVMIETFVALIRASVTSIFNADAATPGKVKVFSPQDDSPLRTRGGEPITTMAHLLAFVDEINPLG